MGGLQSISEKVPAFGGDGQTLLEVLAALGAAVLVVGAITASVIAALSNTQFSKSQNIATQYAQQGMELVRQIRDNDWTGFQNLRTDRTYCLNQGTTELIEKTSTFCALIDLVFTREVVLERPSPNCAPPTPPPPAPVPLPNATKTTVRVAWSDSKCTQRNFCHEVKLISCLLDYTVVPAP